MVSKEKVIEILDKHGLNHEEAPDNELTVWPCPFCGTEEKNKFYINWKTGLYWCHKGSCEQTGTWYTFLRHIGELYSVRQAFEDDRVDEEVQKRLTQEAKALGFAHEQVWQNREAIKFFKEKRISAQAVRDFKIGARTDTKGVTWLTFPYLSQGKLKNCKYRAINGKRKFRRLPGGESILYNEAYIRSNKAKRVLVVEGETDLLAAYSQGIRWVVGVTIGAKGINPDWIDQLDKFEKIYIAFDSDLAGQRGAHNLAKRLGYERCYNVVLPIGNKDVNEFFTHQYTKEDFLKVIDQAAQFELEGIVPLKEAIRKVAENLKLTGSLDTGIHFPWNSVDSCTGSFIGGDLIVLSGIPGVGKTTFALNISHHLAVHQGIPILFFCQEMRPERLARKVMELHLEKNGKFLKEEDILGVYADLKETPLYFGHAYRDLTVERVKDTIRACVRRYGIEFVIFDHLHFLVRNPTNMTNEIGVAVREFKSLAEDEGVPIVLVVHPRKVIEGRIPTMMDLRDSGLIAADADFVLFVHRRRKGENEMGQPLFEEKTLIRTEKARFSAGGDAWLNFHGEKSLFVGGY